VGIKMKGIYAKYPPDILVEGRVRLLFSVYISIATHTLSHAYNTLFAIHNIVYSEYCNALLFVHILVLFYL
jgi:hypothetical protein